MLKTPRVSANFLIKTVTASTLKGCSLLGLLFLPLRRDNLPKHDHAVAIQEGDARQTFAVLKSVDHERLLRHKVALSHLVGLQRVWVLHFLPTSLLTDLPDDLRDTARGTSAAHEPNRRVPDLDLPGNVEYLDLGVEVAASAKSSVFLVHRHIAGPGHVHLVQTLHVHDVVTGASVVLPFVI